MLHKIIYFTLLATILSGCYPESLKYNLGVGTRWINGTLLDEDGSIIKCVYGALK